MSFSCYYTIYAYFKTGHDYVFHALKYYRLLNYFLWLFVLKICMLCLSLSLNFE